MARRVWFRLIDHNGEDKTSRSGVRLEHDALVVDLWDAVKASYGDSHLRGVAPSDLVIFANGAAFAERHRMGAADSIKALGESPEDPVIVQVPAPQLPNPPAPTAPLQVPKPKWKPDPDLTPVLDKGTLHFVNREDAVEQLRMVHKEAFNAATQSSRGDSWTIALADNELGLGKSTFGTHYIQRCRETWPSDCQSPDFRESLCRCHTLRVVVKPQRFVKAELSFDREQTTRADVLNETVNIALAKALKEQLDLPEGTPLPSYLASPSAIADTSFVEAIVGDVGPLFIVLDEIGQAFAYGDSGDEIAEEKSRTLFLRFCSTVLTAWMNTPGIYFVLMGYASFLRNVGERKDTLLHTASPFKIIRLGLHLIRPLKIEEIIRNTWVDSSKSKTIAQRWALETDAQVENAARIMYDKTCGHPRTMFLMFKNNETFDKFCQADVDPLGPQIDAKAWEAVHRELQTWQSLVKDWLRSILEKKPVDLTKVHGCPHQPGQPQRFVAGVVIAERCHLGWEGEVANAKMYALPRVLAVILLMVCRLRPYLRNIESNIDKVSLAYPVVFEWTCLKRFQELFSEPESPFMVLPSFFGSNTVFGRLRGVQFADGAIDLPKITKGATSGSQPSLESATALPTQWPLLMRQIHERLEANLQEATSGEGPLTSSVCLKPLPQSASADVILMHRSKTATPRKKLRSSSSREVDVSTSTLTVGLAVKNNSTTKFGPSDLVDERSKFDAMFRGLDDVTEAGFGKKTNVLVVCATNYADGLASRFGSKQYVAQGPWGKIHEVLLLDLTTPEKRTEFFGLTSEPDLARVLNELINKAKRERDPSED